MMFIVRFENGCGDHISVLVDVEDPDKAESLAREAIAWNRTGVELNCSQLHSIKPFQPVKKNLHGGTALLVDVFDHEDPTSFDGLL